MLITQISIILENEKRRQKKNVRTKRQLTCKIDYVIFKIYTLGLDGLDNAIRQSIRSANNSKALWGSIN